jgi:hypothetical protein
MNLRASLTCTTPVAPLTFNPPADDLRKRRGRALTASWTPRETPALLLRENLTQPIRENPERCYIHPGSLKQSPACPGSGVKAL